MFGGEPFATTVDVEVRVDEDCNEEVEPMVHEDHAKTFFRALVGIARIFPKDKAKRLDGRNHDGDGEIFLKCWHRNGTKMKSPNEGNHSQ